MKGRFETTTFYYPWKSMEGVGRDDCQICKYPPETYTYKTLHLKYVTMP